MAITELTSEPTRRAVSVPSIACSQEIVSSIMKGRRTTSLIIPANRGSDLWRGPVALLEPYRLAVDTEVGLSVEYAAFGPPGKFQKASVMPAEVSRLTFHVSGSDTRMASQVTLEHAIGDGVWSDGKNWRWQTMVDGTKYANPVAAWRASFFQNFLTIGADQKVLILTGRVMRGNALLIARGH